MRGMTGYGRATGTEGGVSLECSLSCYNKKSLDLAVKLPQFLAEYESVVRKMVQEAFSRGAITVTIRVQSQEADVGSLQRRCQIVRQAAEVSGFFVEDRDLFQAIFSDSELFSMDVSIEKERFSSLLTALVSEAIRMADSSRKEEGACIQQEFQARVDHLDAIRQKIEPHAQGVVEEKIAQLRALLLKYVDESPSLEEKLLREVVLFADKVDVTEELVRVHHHLRELQKTLQEEGPIGKKIDFLLQELLREFSTLGAKTSKAEVSSLVMEARLELDKMREQVHNVE